MPLRAPAGATAPGRVRGSRVSSVCPARGRPRCATRTFWRYVHRYRPGLCSTPLEVTVQQIATPRTPTDLVPPAHRPEAVPDPRQRRLVAHVPDRLQEVAEPHVAVGI